MSELRTHSLRHNNWGGDDPNIEMFADGSTSIHELRNFGKNTIINGCMRAAQRGTSGNTPNGAAQAQYALDRWSIEPRASNYACNWAQSDDVPADQPFSYSLRMWALNATDDGFHFRTSVELPATGRYEQFREGDNWTLSFWAKSDVASRSLNPQIALSDTQLGVATAISQFVAPSGGAQNLTSTWARYTFTYTLPAWAAGTGSLTDVECLLFRFLTNGGNDAPLDYYITGVQFEKGSTASEFEQIPIGLNLLLCQRYFIAGMGSGIGYVVETGSATASAIALMPLSVRMRRAPTLESNFNIYQSRPGSGTDTATIRSTASGALGVLVAFSPLDSSSRIRAVRDFPAMSAEL